MVIAATDVLLTYSRTPELTFLTATSRLCVGCLTTGGRRHWFKRYLDNQNADKTKRFSGR